MLQTLDLFPTKLFIKNVQLDNQKMIEELYRLRVSENKPTPPNSNPWQSDRHIDTNESFYDLVSSLKLMVWQILVF